MAPSRLHAHWLTAVCLTLSAANGALAQNDVNPNDTGIPVDDALANEVATDEDVGLDADLDDELIFFAEVPVVVTSARRQQKITESTAAISIVQSDDIRYRGNLSVPEMLQFTPGIDILFSDRNNVALGVRGMHHQFADRTLVLLDGRNVTSALFGGTDFFRLPIFPGDIERIEVVRGPGGASWGANAFNGVINVIQKKPADVRGVYAFAQVNEFGDTFNHVRWADGSEKWSWRISAGYETRESSEDAVSERRVTSNDFSRDWRVNSEAHYEASDRSSLDLSAAFIHISRGDFEIAGFPNVGEARSEESIDAVYLNGRLNHEFENGATGYLRWYTNIEDVERPSFWTYETIESDIEGQADIPTTDDHRLSLGTNFRWIHIDAKQRAATDFLRDDTEEEFWAGLFAIDAWQVTDDLVIESQLRGDWYSETELDWSGRVSALYTFGDEDNHALRGSVAKAFRAPSYGIREGRTSRVPLPSPPLPPNLFGVELLPTDDLDNEETYYFETGYTTALSQHLTVDVTAYYQIYDELIGFDVLPDPFGVGRVIARLENIDGGEGYGAETVVSYRTERYSLAAWYAHNNFDTDRSNQGIRAFQPAKNKVGLSARVFLPHGVTANVDYKYVSKTKNDPGSTLFGSVSETHRVDVSISKKLSNDTLEATVGVRDLFDETGQPVSAIGAFTSHRTPGRTVFAQVELLF